jgi:hypothetical protein
MAQAVGDGLAVGIRDANVDFHDVSSCVCCDGLNDSFFILIECFVLLKLLLALAYEGH